MARLVWRKGDDRISYSNEGDRAKLDKELVPINSCRCVLCCWKTKRTIRTTSTRMSLLKMSNGTDPCDVNKMEISRDTLAARLYRVTHVMKCFHEKRRMKERCSKKMHVSSTAEEEVLYSYFISIRADALFLSVFSIGSHRYLRSRHDNVKDFRSRFLFNVARCW